MNFAIIENNGKQHIVKVGSLLSVDNLNLTPHDEVVFDKVLLYVDKEKVKIGTPYLSGFTVKAKVIDSYKDKKVDVIRYRAKSRRRRKVGFRGVLTRISIENIHESKKGLTIQVI